MKIKYGPELRIFPNDKNGIGHENLEERKEFLFGGMKPTSLRNREGIYRVENIKQLNRISSGSYALFRFEDYIIGEGKIISEVKRFKKNDKYFIDGLQGYIEFSEGSLFQYKHKITMSELEELTGKYPGKRNSWTRFEISYLEKIREIGKVAKDQGDIQSLNSLDTSRLKALLKEWISLSASSINLNESYENIIEKGPTNVMLVLSEGNYAPFKRWFRWILHGRGDIIRDMAGLTEIEGALMLFNPYEVQEFLGDFSGLKL